MDTSEKTKILKIYISEQAKYHGHNLHHAIVKKMHEMDMAGVTVTRGIEGYGSGKRIHSAKVVELSMDLPIIIEIIDSVSKLELAIPVLKEMVTDGLMLLAEVEVIQYGSVLK